MTQPAAERPKVQPLTCPHCGGPVPLADARSVTCPYCKAQVPIPPEYWQLRRERETLSVERKEAETLYRRLGRVPPGWLSRFQMFESPLFWLVGAGFFLAGAVFVGVVFVGVMNFGLELLGKSDLARRTGDALSTGFAMESLWVGVLLAGWSHKRMVSRAGLQAALASAPPSTPGGPALCRRCGAALAVPPGALGVRCDYCGADNLVAVPAEWLEATKKVDRVLVNEERTALQAEAYAQRALWRSLAWRLLICLLFLSVPLGIYYGG